MTDRRGNLGAAGDKSLEEGEGEEEQDHSLDVKEFSPYHRGVKQGVRITARASDTGGILGGIAAGAGVGTVAAGAGLTIASAAGKNLSGAAVGLILGAGAVAGGITGGILGHEVFNFTQTINTNAPKGGTTSPYVDPRPNDDDKPFYYTDAEKAKFGNTFIDRPSRRPPTAGTTVWDATLCANSVNDKTVVAHDCLTYGFSFDSARRLTTHPAKKTDASAHQTVLASEFPGWTFVTVEKGP